MTLFGLLVAFLGGVITGAMLIFFARGPLVAYFRLADEPEHQPVPLASAELLGPAHFRPRPRRRSTRPATWQRVTPGSRDAVAPVPSREAIEPTRVVGGAR